MAKSARRKPMSDINVVPYIDVMLVLLVIFMVTAPLMTQGIKVDLPEANSEALKTEEDMLVVTITAEGQYFLNIGEDQKTMTLKEIGDFSSRIIAANPKVPVMIEGDHQLQYGRVVELMTVLQQAGAESVGLITEPPRR